MNDSTCLLNDDVDTCDLPSYIVEPWRTFDRGFLLQVCPEDGSTDEIELDMTLKANNIGGEVSNVQFPEQFIQDLSVGNEDCLVLSTRGHKVMEVKSISGKYNPLLIFNFLGGRMIVRSEQFIIPLTVLLPVVVFSLLFLIFGV